jgi:hypothetical protein
MIDRPNSALSSKKVRREIYREASLFDESAECLQGIAAVMSCPRIFL